MCSSRSTCNNRLRSRIHLTRQEIAAQHSCDSGSRPKNMMTVFQEGAGTPDLFRHQFAFQAWTSMMERASVFFVFICQKCEVVRCDCIETLVSDVCEKADCVTESNGPVGCSDAPVKL